MDGRARTGSGCRPMNSRPRDNARPVCLDACLEPRLAIGLLSTVQTQPQESADAKRLLGLEARSELERPELASYINHVNHIYHIKCKTEFFRKTTLDCTVPREVPGQRCHLYG